MKAKSLLFFIKGKVTQHISFYSSPLDSSQKLPCILLPDNEPLLLDVPKPPVPSNSAHSLHSMKSNVSGVSSQWEDHHIPDGAECVQVLVGRTGIFDETKFILIRLQKPLLDFHLTKKRIPIRFIVLIVGPVEANNTFLEMGRVFSSLAINKVTTSTHLFYIKNSCLGFFINALFP